MKKVSRVQPEAIKKIWSALRYGLEKSLPPTAKQNMHSYTQVLAELLSGKAQCWVAYEASDEGNLTVYAFAITFIRNDPLTKDRYLHLYAMYGLKPLDDEDWLRLYDIVTKFADGNDCHALTSFTNNPALHKRFELMGGKNDWSYWYKEL